MKDELTKLLEERGVILSGKSLWDDICTKENAIKIWGEEDRCRNCGCEEFKKETINEGYCGGCEVCGTTEEKEVDICVNCDWQVEDENKITAYEQGLRDLLSEKLNGEDWESSLLTHLKENTK